MSRILEVENLSFSYEGTKILDRLSFFVEEHEFAVIVGDNGAGKTTLMNLILGNLSPENGDIRRFGEPLHPHPHERRIAYISQTSVQGYRSFPTTIKEAVRIHQRYLGHTKDRDEILRLVGLENHADKRLNQLSGGQLQRTAIALALIKDAELILLDEPTAGIDKKFSLELYELLARLKKSKTIVMITHHLNETEPYVDRVIHLADGHCTVTVR